MFELEECELLCSSFTVERVQNCKKECHVNDVLVSVNRLYVRLLQARLLCHVSL